MKNTSRRGAPPDQTPAMKPKFQLRIPRGGNGARKGLLRGWILRVPLSAALLLAPLSQDAHAYVGPGAGFAFISTFFIFFVTFVLAVFTLLTWPVRWAIRAIFSSRKSRRTSVKRVVIVGLDGQDPELTADMMGKGLLPNFARLRETGSFERLGTSLPAESPVAWSSFQTGCNPGKHRIYDFLAPNRKIMTPELSSSSVASNPKTLNLGPYRIPLGKPRISVGRKSRAFWNVLSDYGVFCNIIRVPLTFPPEKLNGALLSAMCLPDLKGSQGTYFYYTSDPAERRQLSSGIQLPLERKNGSAFGRISGPENSLRADGGEMEVPFEIRLGGGDAPAELIVGKDRYPLKTGEYTPWVPVTFKPGLGMKVRGICKFLLLEREPNVRLYMTPLQIDPEKPALPISHPYTYAVYLAKAEGPFATLGVAEDTSALNEGVIGEEAFIEQCQTIHREREAMFFDALDKTPAGCVACVFDITDRLQHMFMRYLDETHPAHKGHYDPQYQPVIQNLYRQMDELVGRVMHRLDENDVLIVMSDHGFKPFRRGVNLNNWLRDNGYLFLKDGATECDMLSGVDWRRTRAYAVGFGGVYLNQEGREAHGIVKPGEESENLKREITAKLLELTDGQTGETPVKQVYDSREAYKGPYVKDAPDLIAGFRVGYRVAWSSVTGGLGEATIEDNTRPWSGDHNMNPADVPGMFFCNRPIEKTNPHIEDIGPSVLDLFGVPVPGYCDGESIGIRETAAAPDDSANGRLETEESEHEPVNPQPQPQR